MTAPIHNWIAGWKGKFGTAAYGTVTPIVFYDVEEFGMDHMVTTDDITNTGGGGAQDVLDCIESANGQVTFVYDPTIEPEVSPQQFAPRGKCVLILQPDGVSQYSFYALIVKVSWKSGPKSGAVRCVVDFMSKGAITRPSADEAAVTVET